MLLIYDNLKTIALICISGLRGDINSPKSYFIFSKILSFQFCLFLLWLVFRVDYEFVAYTSYSGCRTIF